MVRSRSLPGLFLGALLVISLATAAQALVATPTETSTPQAAVAPNSACTRLPDYVNTCVCPAGSQVIVQGEAVATPAMLWWGISFSHMTTQRWVGTYGINPTEYSTTGIHSKATGQTGPVYYSTGSGWQASQWSWMGAYCQQAWRAPAPESAA